MLCGMMQHAQVSRLKVEDKQSGPQHSPGAGGDRHVGPLGGVPPAMMGLRVPLPWP